MAFSQITITFNDDLTNNEMVSFRRRYNNGQLVGPWSVITEQWKNNRLAPNQVEIGTPTLIPGERAAINYLAAIQLDYLWLISPGLQTFTRDENQVIIRMPVEWTFDLNSLPGTNSPNVTIVIGNFDNPLFLVTNVEHIAATTNPVCTHFKVRVTCSVPCDSYGLPDGTTVDNTGDLNPVEFEHPRNASYAAIFVGPDSQTVTVIKNVNQVPPLFNAAQIQPVPESTPTGGSVVIQVLQSINQLGITFEYSLNNTEWFTSNTFTGLTNGTYNAYVRDPWGCVQFKEFLITTNNISLPHHYVSESLPIRFAERVTEGTCTPIAKPRQLLSVEEEAEDETLVYEYFHPLLKCGTRWLQFESNFSNPRVEVIQENGTVTQLLLTQKTNHIGITDKRDALKYKRGTKTGIYFISGDVYDYISDAVIGDHFLNGGLPEYAEIGNFINIDGDWFTIENIVFDEDINAEVIVIDTNNSTATPQPVVASSEFNRENFEVYECILLGSAFDEQYLQLKIIHADNNFDTVEYLSEKVDLRELHPGTVGIKYWNNKNTDVYYKTGIQFETRAALLKVAPTQEEDQEPLKSDVEAMLLQANMHDVLEYEFDSVTKGIYRQLTRALTHQNCFIAEQGVVKNASFEGELQGDTNLMLLKAIMLLTNVPYTTDVTGSEPNLIDANETLEVPNLIAPEDDAFIGY